MTALFVAPSPFIVQAANQQGSTAGNLASNEPALVWRSADLASPYVVIDLGPSPAPYDTVALVGSNLRATDTIQVLTGTSTSGTGSFDNTARAAFSGTKPTGFTTKSVYRFTARSERYLKVAISAPSHPEGFVKAQRIVVGKAVTTSGIDYNAEHSIVDDSNVETKMGVDVIEEAGWRLRWKFSMGWVNATSWDTEWMGFIATVKTVTPVFFIPFYEDATKFQAQATFGRFRKMPVGKLISTNYRSVDMELEGLAS